MRSSLRSPFLLLATLSLSSGCQPSDSSAPTAPQSDSNQPQAVVPTAPPAATRSAASSATDLQTAEVVATALEPVAVRLGSDELTAGIPGTGEVTTAQISAWLADPENHRELRPELPLGLAAAAANIQGLDANPLTRAKIELGRQLYFDPRLSSDGAISCASCHHPDEGFGRHTQFGEGVGGQTGNRNSPVSYNRIVSGPQFWDGRAASLEEQAVGPIANPIEMGSTHESCVAGLKQIEGYRLQFAKIFPQQGITIDTVGQAIASFERTIVSLPAPYDYFEKVRTIEQGYADELADLKTEDPEVYAEYEEALEGSRAMSASAKRGRDLFFADRVGCTACHAGANFTDEKYHNLGVGMDAAEPDWGRFVVTQVEADKGAFKTPTMRNVALSAPYMHDGSQATLMEVVKWYDQGGHPNPYLSDKVKKLSLTEQEQQDLVAFMVEGLSSPFPKIETGRLPK